MSDNKKDIIAKYDVYERKKNGIYIKILTDLSYDEAVVAWRRKMAKRKIEPVKIKK